MTRILVVLFLLMLSNFAFAKDFQGTSEYFITDISTKNIAIEFARDMAKQSALEQAGTFVSSLSESSMGLLTKDDIKTVTLGFAKLKPGSEKADFSAPNQAGTIVLSYSAVFSIDENEIATNLARFKQDNREIENLRLQILSEQKAFSDLENKYRSLQEKYSLLKTEQEKTAYNDSIVDIQNSLSSMDYFKNAVDCMTRKKYSDALMLFDRALAGFQDYAKNNPAPWLSQLLASIFYQKGVIYQNFDQIVQAEQFYKAALQVSPDLVYPYLGLAFIYTKAGNSSAAISAANTAVKLRPDDLTYYARMTTYANFNMFKEACEDFWKLQDPLPKATFAGWCYINAKDNKKAVQAFDMALKHNPIDFAAYYGRGRANAGLKNDEEAVRDFTKVITLAPDNYHAYAERGASYLFLKQYQLAYNDALYALSHKPDDDTAPWVLEEARKHM